MLVATSRALRDSLTRARVRDWPGTFVLVTLPGDDPASVASVPADAVVVECLDHPPSNVWLLSGVMRRLRHLPRDHAPYLFVAEPLAEPLLPPDDAWAVQHGVDPTGDLSWLCLGPAVAASPLLTDLFLSVDDHPLSGEELADLVRAALVWESA